MRLVLSLVFAAAAFAQTYDVVVVGATTAGIGAAIAAGRQGMRVALIEETPTIGGLLVNGLSNTDLRSPGGSSGLFEEFRLRSQKYYTTNFPDDPAMQHEPMAKLGFRYEPHVAEKIIRQMIAEIPSIKIFNGRYATQVLKSGQRVTGVVTKDIHDANELTFRAAITIDATHEGDLLPLTGAKFRLGREPRSEEEPHAGAIYMTHDGEILGSGQGDDKIQAFAMLATIKDYGPGVDKSIPMPPHYDAKNYAPEPKNDTFWFKGGVLPNHKYELNENMDGTDAADLNTGYITGNRALRAKIWEKYRDYTLGYIYFRQHVMGEKSIALADDEFVENHNLPYELYVREGRRLEGIAMFKERDAIKVPTFPRPPLRADSIAVGDWAIDSHAVSRDTEGYIYFAMGDRFHTSAPYQAPYGIMVPQEIDGLLVPMAVSSTHVGFQVLRLEAIRVAMGQAAGDAASLCVKLNLQPRAVPVPKLQSMLLDQNQSLYYYTDVIPSTPHFQAIERISMAGIARGYDDFSFKPEKPASHADAAKSIFRALNMTVKMDYTDLWDIMRWPVKIHNSQHCTPDHWGTYYILTFYNLGAFSKQALADMNPDAPTSGEELSAWAKLAAKSVPTIKPGPVTRAELAQFIIDLK